MNRTFAWAVVYAALLAGLHAPRAAAQATPVEEEFRRAMRGLYGRIQTLACDIHSTHTPDHPEPQSYTGSYIRAGGCERGITHGVGPALSHYNDTILTPTTRSVYDQFSNSLEIYAREPTTELHAANPFIMTNLLVWDPEWNVHIRWDEALDRTYQEFRVTRDAGGDFRVEIRFERSPLLFAYRFSARHHYQVIEATFTHPKYPPPAVYRVKKFFTAPDGFTFPEETIDRSDMEGVGGVRIPTVHTALFLRIQLNTEIPESTFVHPLKLGMKVSDRQAGNGTPSPSIEGRILELAGDWLFWLVVLTAAGVLTGVWLVRLRRRRAAARAG